VVAITRPIEVRLKNVKSLDCTNDIITSDNKKMIKNDIPPREGFDVGLHLMMVCDVSRIPKVLENLSKNLFIISENMTDAIKNTLNAII